MQKTCLLNDRRGATAVEYGLIAALLAFGCAVGAGALFQTLGLLAAAIEAVLGQV